METLKIAYVASEIVPFAKTGGLADVSGALGKYLARRGHDIRLFMPYYDSLNLTGNDVHPVAFIRNIPVSFNGFTLYFSALTTTLPDSDAQVYFIHSEGLYNRGKIYTEHPDEYLRFALLSRAALECCQRMGWGPDIVHCNDWQTGLLPVFLKTLYDWDALFANTRTLMTIHNIGYQGVFGDEVVSTLNMDPHRAMLPHDDQQAGIVNFMKTGLIHADHISTVSETYAREIQTAEYGAGLDGLLRHLGYKLSGILNGVDYQEWSPEHDPFIPHAFSAADLSGKYRNRAALLERMGLSDNPDAPVFGIISRLVAQKGFDLMEEMLFPFLADHDLRLVILGSGEERFTHLFMAAAEHFPEKVRFYNGYNIELSHLIEAGSDAFIMPSHYEPCGLNQIYSLRYGTVPVVRKTGGLADTVQLYDWTDQSGTGFVFEDYTAQGLRWALDYAMSTYHHKDAWQQLMRNGMALDFSWDRQVGQYEALYARLLGR